MEGPCIDMRCVWGGDWWSARSLPSLLLASLCQGKTQKWFLFSPANRDCSPLLFPTVQATLQGATPPYQPAELTSHGLEAMFYPCAAMGVLPLHTRCPQEAFYMVVQLHACSTLGLTHTIWPTLHSWFHCIQLTLPMEIPRLSNSLSLLHMVFVVGVHTFSIAPFSHLEKIWKICMYLIVI